MPVNRLASVTRCTVKETFSGKQRGSVSKILKSINRRPVKKAAQGIVPSYEPANRRRAPYFKKFRDLRRLLSIMRRYPLPRTYNRDTRRILRGVYYSIPLMSRFLLYPPDQLVLEEMEETLYCWLLLANIERKSASQIYRPAFRLRSSHVDAWGLSDVISNPDYRQVSAKL